MKTRIIQDEPDASAPPTRVAPREKRNQGTPRAPQRRRALAWFTRRIRSLESSGVDAFAALAASRTHRGTR